MGSLVPSLPYKAQQQSRLLGMPPEIRLNILRFALQADEPLFTRSNYYEGARGLLPTCDKQQWEDFSSARTRWMMYKTGHDSPPDPKPVTGYRLDPALLATCQRLYWEGSAVLHRDRNILAIDIEVAHGAGFLLTNSTSRQPGRQIEIAQVEVPAFVTARSMAKIRFQKWDRKAFHPLAIKGERRHFITYVPPNQPYSSSNRTKPDETIAFAKRFKRIELRISQKQLSVNDPQYSYLALRAAISNVGRHLTRCRVRIIIDPAMQREWAQRGLLRTQLNTFCHLLRCKSLKFIGDTSALPAGMLRDTCAIATSGRPVLDLGARLRQCRRLVDFICEPQDTTERERAAAELGRQLAKADDELDEVTFQRLERMLINLFSREAGDVVSAMRDGWNDV